MPLTSPPNAPSRTTGRETFSADMDAMLAYIKNTWHPEMVAAMLAFGPGQPYCTATGTNAQVLTSGLNIASLVVGQRVRFKAAGANTGATTIKLDGTAAVACRTITGVALPSGYIRTDVVTEAWYDGTYWVVDRLPEVSGNAETGNGRYVRYANGEMQCRRRILATTTTGAVPWTYPAVFSDEPVISHSVVGSGGLNLSAEFPAVTASSLDVSVRNVSNARVATIIDLTAHGQWY